MASVSLSNISKAYQDLQVVHGISLDIRDGEFVVLVGPSGCGKSTTLRMIAGLETVTSGDLFIGDQRVNEIAPKDRDIAMVFQNYALYPHMSVYQNLAFGLKLRSMPKIEIQKRVENAAEITGLTPYLNRKPATLSGGQRQRVALARAIVRDPKVFLFDEPLSNLDAKLRVQMRMEITRLQKRLGVTTVYVTHDQTEAMTMADRIAVMKDGVLQQYDTPMNIYRYPINIFVAGFIGSPSMNLIEGRIQDKEFKANGGDLKIDLSGYLPEETEGREIIIGIRPEDLHGDNGLIIESYFPWKVHIEAVEPLGSDSFLYFKHNNKDMIARILPESHSLERQQREIFIDRSRLHYFDIESGLRI